MMNSAATKLLAGLAGSSRIQRLALSCLGSSGPQLIDALQHGEELPTTSTRGVTTSAASHGLDRRWRGVWRGAPKHKSEVLNVTNFKDYQESKWDTGVGKRMLAKMEEGGGGGRSGGSGRGKGGNRDQPRSADAALDGVICDTQSLVEMDVAVRQLLDALTPRHAASAIIRVPNLLKAPDTAGGDDAGRLAERLLDRLVPVLFAKLGDVSTHQVCLVMWALGRAAYQLPGDMHAQLTDMLLADDAAVLQTATLDDLARLAMGLSRLQADHSQLWAALAAACRQQLAESGGAAAVTARAALPEASYSNKEGRKRSSSSSNSSSSSRAVAALSGGLPQVRPIAVANLATALAQANVRDMELFDDLVAVVTSGGVELDEQLMARLVWAAAKVGHRGVGPLLDLLAPRIKPMLEGNQQPEVLSPKVVSTVLWALATSKQQMTASASAAPAAPPSSGAAGAPAQQQQQQQQMDELANLLCAAVARSLTAFDSASFFYHLYAVHSLGLKQPALVCMIAELIKIRGLTSFGGAKLATDALLRLGLLGHSDRAFWGWVTSEVVAGRLPPSEPLATADVSRLLAAYGAADRHDLALYDWAVSRVEQVAPSLPAGPELASQVAYLVRADWPAASVRPEHAAAFAPLQQRMHGALAARLEQVTAEQLGVACGPDLRSALTTLKGQKQVSAESVLVARLHRLCKELDFLVATASGGLPASGGSSSSTAATAAATPPLRLGGGISATSKAMRPRPVTVISATAGSS